jgi:hypothetical protein
MTAVIIRAHSATRILSFLLRLRCVSPDDGKNHPASTEVGIRSGESHRLFRDPRRGCPHRLLANGYSNRADVPEKLLWLREHNPASRLVLRAERDSKVGDVRSVVDAARSAGYERITIETASIRPLLLRRLDDLTVLHKDESVLQKPPSQGFDFEMNHLWY